MSLEALFSSPVVKPSKRGWVVGLALVGLCGCVSDKSAKKPEEAQARDQVAPPPIRPAPAANEKVTEQDTNGDDKPDVWRITVDERVVRKELDINWDGRVDITTSYDARGEREREAMDLDFDGKVDSVYFYEKGINVRRERDLNGDGKPDVWVFYEKGQLARKERDSNGDSRVDYWEYWENNQVDRIGEDLDGDGNVDKWSRGTPAE
jgi:hypothetical protein